jgi:hypothetical protein
MRAERRDGVRIDHRLSKIERDLLWLKWMAGVVLGGIAILCIKAFLL